MVNMRHSLQLLDSLRYGASYAFQTGKQRTMVAVVRALPVGCKARRQIVETMHRPIVGVSRRRGPKTLLASAFDFRFYPMIEISRMVPVLSSFLEYFRLRILRIIKFAEGASNGALPSPADRVYADRVISRDRH